MLGGYIDSASEESPAIGPWTLRLDRSRHAMTFDPASQEWRDIAEVPSSIKPIGATTSMGVTYVLGALRPYFEDSPRVLYAYTPASDEWVQVPLPPYPGQLIDAGGHLVNIGQDSGGAVVSDSVFDARNQRWVTLPRDPFGSKGYRSAVWDGKRIVVASAAPRTSIDDGPALVRLAALKGLTNRPQWHVLAKTTRIVSFVAPILMPDRHTMVWPETGSAQFGSRRVPLGGVLDLQSLQQRPLTKRSGQQVSNTTTVPSGLVVGDRVTLNGTLYDPTTGSSTPLPVPPGAATIQAAYAGGPDTLLRYGGAQEFGLIVTTWLPTNAAYIYRR